MSSSGASVSILDDENGPYIMNMDLNMSASGRATHVPKVSY